MQTLGVTTLHLMSLCVQEGSQKVRLNLEFLFYVCRRMVGPLMSTSWNNSSVGIVVDLQQHGVHIKSENSGSYYET